jgi:hypothetical protein
MSSQRNAPQGGTHAAIIRVRAPSGRLRTFDAERVEVEHGLATAAGWWRHDLQRQRQVYIWPARQLVEIRYLREVVAA